MSLKQRSSFVLLLHRLVPVALLLFTLVSVFILNLRHTPLASAATSNTINFQARLQSAGGAIVPDGNYNVQFKLYSASSGGTALWTENDYNSASQGARTVNGYFTVKLGSVTAFPTINWDQQLWLTMNVGGTSTGTPTLDGEMNPRLQLTAVPYAFTAGQLSSTNGSGHSTLSFQGSSSGDQNFVIQDQGAAGTYNLLTNNSGVQLQTTTPGTAQTGNINISGTGVFGTALQSLSLDTTSAATLSIGTANASTVNIATNDSAHTIGIGTGAAAQSVTVGSTNGASSLLLQAGTGNVTLATNNSSASIIAKSGTNSTAAFQVQSASGITLLNADTTNGRVSIGTSGTATGQLYVSGKYPTTMVGNVASSQTSGGHMQVFGSYGYETISNSDFVIFDVANPAAPTKVGTLTGVLGGTGNVVVVGHYAYTYSSGLKVIDVSNPASPSLAYNGTISSSGAGGIYIRGNYAYIGVGSALQTYDISNPTSPHLVSSLSTTAPLNANNNGITGSGNFLYAAGDSATAGLMVFSLANPAAPALAKNVTTSVGERSVVVQGKYAYVGSAGESGMRVYDVSDPTNPSLLYSGGPSGSGDPAYMVSVSGHILYNEAYGCFVVTDITTPTAPNMPYGGYTCADIADDSMSVIGRYMYLINSSTGHLNIYDLGGAYTQQLQAGSTQTGTLQVDQSASVSGDLSVGGGITGSGLGIVGDAGFAGKVSIQTTTNSTSAFQVQNSSGATLLNADTTNSAISINANTIISGVNISGSTAAVVQQTTATTSGNNSLTATFGSSTTVGDTLVVGAEIFNNAHTVQSVSGGGVTTWHQISAASVTGNRRQEVWYGTVTSPGTAVTTTQSSGGDDYSNLIVAEVSGLAASPLDQAASQYTTSTTATTPSITTTTANEIVFAFAQGDNYDDAYGTPSDGFTALNSAYPDWSGGAYQTTSSTGSYSTSWTHGGSTDNFETSIVSFKSLSSQPDILDIATSGGAVVSSISSTGSATFKNSTNSSSAFQIQNASGTVLLNADTTNNRITVGNTSTGGGIINNGATLNTAKALGNLNYSGSGNTGAIGTAAATVDAFTSFTIAQTTAGQTFTIPSPTDTTAGRLIYIANIGTQSFTTGGVVISAGSTSSFMWNGSSWVSTAVSTGVSLLGALDGGTANSTGGSIVGNSLYLQSASTTNPGLINTGTQSFAGAKTFAGGLTAASNDSLQNSPTAKIQNTSTGNATVELNASGSSYYVGVDTSNSGAFSIGSSYAANGSGTNLGYTTVGTSSGWGTQNGMQGNAVTTGGSAVTANSISVYFTAVDPSNKNAQVAIYTDNAGVPGTKVASSSSQVLTTGWNTIPISVSLSASTKYWMVVNSQGVDTIAFDGGGTSAYVNQTYGTWPATSTGWATSGYTFSMYLTYSSSGIVNDYNGALLTLSQSGQATFKNSTNSTTAFQIQNASGTSLVTADTSGMAVTIGGGLNVSGTGVFTTALQAPSLDTASAGTLSIGGTNATTVNIANNAAAHTIAIGTGAAAQSVTIGSTNGASSLVLQSGTGNLSIQTQGTGVLGIGSNSVAQTINIGNTTGATAVNLLAGSGGINIGSTGSSTAGSTTNIGTTSNGTGTQAVNIGSTAGSSNAVNINGGTGSSAVQIQAGSGGTIRLGSVASAQSIVIGNTAGAGSVSISAGSGGIALNGAVSISSGGTFTNASSTLNTAISITDMATGGNIGASAAATVDVATTINIAQSTTGQTMTLRSPSVATAGRVVYVSDTGSASFKIGSVIISSNTTAIFMWNGSTWTSAGIDGTGSNYIQNTTSNQSANLNIQAATGGTVGATIAAATSGSGDVLDLLNGSSATVVSVSSTGNVLFKASTASANAFQIQDASSNSMLKVDTSTGTITFGSGSNTVIFTATGGLVASGTAQHGKSIVLSPEYAGAVFDAAGDSSCSSANSGSLSSAYDATNYRNYYNWTATSGTSQCYDVVVDVQLPSDFSSWAASTPLNVQALASNTSNAGYAIAVRDNTTSTWDGNYGSSYASPGTISTSWGNVATSGFSGTYSAGDRLTIKIRMTSKSSANLQLSNLTLSYNSKY